MLFFPPTILSGGVLGLIPQETGTLIGNMTAGGGLAAAFDGTRVHASLSASANRSGANGYVGKNYSSQPKRISSAQIWGPNIGDGPNYANNWSGSVTAYLYAKTGGAPSNGTDGTSLGSVTFSDDAGTDPRTISSSNPTSSWDYVWVYLDTEGNADLVRIGEVEFSGVN